jgi:hypothetical protein
MIEFPLFVSSMVTAATADCTAIQRSLELARAEGLETKALQQLERTHCTTGQSEVCVDVSTLWLMSMVVRAHEQTAALDAQRTLTCSMPQERELLLSWPDRSTLRTRSGTWSWDDGAIAKTSSSSPTWYWPSGALARSANGTLFYPNGALARSATGAWYLPNGDLTQGESGLGSAACKVNLEVCRAWLAYLPVTSGAARDVALVGLGWSSRR